MTGENLLNELIAATGLPKEALKLEMKQLIEQRGAAISEISLDDIRIILVEYLQKTILESKAHYSK